MEELLPQAYLIGLIALLGIAAAVVGRQILRVRRDEVALARLGGNAANDRDRPADASGLYELASVQLRKRLYGQAVDNLKLALRRADSEQAPDEARALIENALGFGLAAQNQLPAAIRHYRSALRAKGDYPVAMNNLAFALEKQQKHDEAEELYQRVLSLEPGNRTASKRLKRLEARRAAGEKAA